MIPGEITDSLKQNIQIRYEKLQKIQGVKQSNIFSIYFNISFRYLEYYKSFCI